MGLKTVEGRKNCEKYQKYKVGDTLEFKCGDDLFATKITYIHKYFGIRDYLEKETLEKALPGVQSMEEGIRIYNKFNSEKERTKLREKYGYGVLGIGIKPLSIRCL